DVQRDVHSFPTRRSSDLGGEVAGQHFTGGRGERREKTPKQHFGQAAFGSRSETRARFGFGRKSHDFRYRANSEDYWRVRRTSSRSEEHTSELQHVQISHA